MVVVVGLAFLAVNTASAKERKSAGKAGVKVEKKITAETTLEGVVTVTKEGDTVKQITIGEGDTKVCVCMTDDEGKKLADMNGKKVKATGQIQEKAGKKVVKVTKAEEVTETK